MSRMTRVRRYYRTVTPPATGGGGGPAVGSADRPKYDVPVFLDWNPVTRLHDLKPEKAAQLPFAATVPHATGTTLTLGSDRVANMATLNAAIQAARSASGTSGVRALARIIVDHTKLLAGSMDVTNINLFDEVGSPIYLHVETTARASLPAEETRVAIGDGLFMPALGINSYNQSAIMYDWTTKRVRCVGLWGTVDATVAAAVIADPSTKPGLAPGTAAFTPLSYNGVFGPRQAVPPTPLLEAEDIILDRCLFTVPDGVDFRKCVWADFTRFSMLECWAENRGDVHWVDNSTYCIAGTTGGEHVIRNCLIAGARGEWAFTGGGGKINAVERVANDIWIRSCHFTSFQRWLDQGHSSKNAWEMKSGLRQLMEACLITNCWTAGILGNQRHTFAFKTEDNATIPAEEEPFIYTKDIQVHACLMRNCTGTLGVFSGNRLVAGWTQEARKSFETIKRVGFTHVVREPMDWGPFNTLFPGSPETWDTFGVFLSTGVARSAGAAGGVPVDYYATGQLSMQHCSWGNAVNVPPGGRKYVPALLIEGGFAAMYDWSICNTAFFCDYVQEFDSPLKITVEGALVSPASGWATLLARAGSVVDFRNNAMGTVFNPATQFTGPTGPSNVARTDNDFGQNPATLRPLTGSQLLAAGSDGGNIGADFALLDAAMVNVETGGR